MLLRKQQQLTRTLEEHSTQVSLAAFLYLASYECYQSPASCQMLLCTSFLYVRKGKKSLRSKQYQVANARPTWNAPHSFFISYKEHNNKAALLGFTERLDHKMRQQGHPQLVALTG